MPETVAPAVEKVDIPQADALKEDDPTAGNENIVPGPATLSSCSDINEKKMAKVVKEGGKRGVELEGAADMGGLAFFCTMMGEMTEGRVDLLIESMKAMNAVSDPSEEERKGGAGKLGKMIFSFTEQRISAVAYVPKDKDCNAKEWLTEVVTQMTNSSKYAEEHMKTFEDSDNVSSKHWAAIQIDADGEKNLFPIKMRDPAITMALTFLRKRGLYPEDDEEDDDEYVFGDDDFP